MKKKKKKNKIFKIFYIHKYKIKKKYLCIYINYKLLNNCIEILIYFNFFIIKHLLL